LNVRIFGVILLIFAFYHNYWFCVFS